MRKLLPLLLTLVLLTAIVPIQAQDTDAACLEGAQRWYYDIDQNRELLTYWSVVTSETNTVNRYSAFQLFSRIVNLARELEYPSCIENVRETYLDGLHRLGIALFAYTDDDFETYAQQLMLAAQDIGYARGYLARMGITLVDEGFTTGSGLRFK